MATVIEYLNSLGLTIMAEGENLLVGPRQLMTDELRQLLRAHKPALLRLLGAPARPRLVAVNHSPQASTKRPAVYKVTVAGERIALIDPGTAPPAEFIAQIQAQFGAGQVETTEPQ